jgi:PAS domain S-box-containing protein
MNRQGGFSFTKPFRKNGYVMTEKPTYEELERRVQELESFLAVKSDGYQPSGNTVPGLADIVDMQVIQSLMNHFYTLTNIGVAILDLKGNVLVATGWQEICVRFHRVHPETCKNCLESDLILSNGITPGSFKLYRCKNHMWDMATPIMAGTVKVGNLFLGQFFFDDELPDINTFREHARRYGFNENKYLSALEKVPRWNRKTVNEVMGFYTKLANLISDLSYRNLLLNKNEEILSRSQELAHIGSWKLDLIENHMTWSDEVYRIFGCEPQAFAATNEAFLDAVHPDDRERVNKAYSGSIQEGRSEYEIQHRIVRHSTGEIRTIHQRCIHERDGTGAIVQSVGMLQDITERRQAEKELLEKEQRFRIMADGSPVMIWVHDAKGNIEFINMAYRDFFGVDLEQVRGHNWQPLVHPDHRESYTGAFMQALNDQKPFHAEAYVKTASGEWRWIESYGSPRLSADGKFCGMVGSSPDITDRKRAEENLRRLNEALEQKVAERTQVAKDRAKKLQTLVGELTLAEQKERQRIGKILHDNLQQLLVGARINSEILCRSVEKKHEKIAKTAFDLISQSIQTSRSLTAELYPAVLQQGLSASLQWTVRWMNENHGLTIDLQKDPDIEPKQEEVTAFLYQSTRELLLNVIKHSGVKSARLKMACDEEKKQLWITVSDNGAGFDPGAFLKNEGTGFGLFSIQERLQLMGGRIQIETSPGKGATLSLIVPLETQEEKKDEVTAEIKTEDKTPKTGKDKISILVVDDHPVVRQGILALLSHHPDIEMVGEADDGYQAVEKARQLNPDVILMDINMPGMDGIHATRIIRSELPCVRIIGLSMHDRQDQADQMIQAGASDYCSKDGSTDELLSAIRRSDYHCGGDR